MKATNIKGALLEYIVRNLLKNCGFTNVSADNVYTFENSGLFFVNGKGAAHDADVIMNPPIQMPFTYPTQLIFECKAYEASANLTIVRNALGLRNDLNDFEIVSKESLNKRKNNRRASYAIETRRRFIFQVGVASVNDFSKPAVEFATNNKIPLFSLSWFLGASTIDKFNEIKQPFIDSFDLRDIENVYAFLKDRNGNIHNEIYERASKFLSSENILGDIVVAANLAINYSFVGLLETGDMVYLFARSPSEENILKQKNIKGGFKAKIHWMSDRPNVWRLTVSHSELEGQQTQFDFYVPKRIFDYWKQFDLSKSAALGIKEEFFSKIFVFNKRDDPEYPFSIIIMDEEWLGNARQELSEE